MEENYPEINNEEISRINEGPRETDPFDGGVTAPLAGDDADSKAAFYSLATFIAFLFMGNVILQLFHVDISSFAIAGS